MTLPLPRAAWAALGAGFFCAAAPVAAQQLPAPSASERVHVVRPGDTLWDLARSYLGDPFLWPELFRLNPDVIRDPALIYPGEQLRLAAVAGMRIAEGGEPERTVFFPAERTPQPMRGPVIRAAGTADVPVLTPGDFFRAGFLAPEREVPAVGRLAETLSPTVLPANLPPLVSLYDKVFVTLQSSAEVQIGERLQFVRQGRSIKPYGFIWIPTGIATVAAIDGNVATAVVVELMDAVAVGDLAMRVGNFPVPPGVSPTPAAGISAELIAFQTEQPLYGTQEIAFVDVGEQAGVVEGDEFLAYLPPERKRWGVRPEVPIARLQIVRVADRTAAARVLEIDHPALEPGLPVRLVGKMP